MLNRRCCANNSIHSRPQVSFHGNMTKEMHARATAVAQVQDGEPSISTTPSVTSHP